MISTLLTACTSFQVHGGFKLDDVSSLITERRAKFPDLHFVSAIVPIAPFEEHSAIVVQNWWGTHVFTLDTLGVFRRCIWDGTLKPYQKDDTIFKLCMWLDENQIEYDVAPPMKIEEMATFVEFMSFEG